MTKITQLPLATTITDTGVFVIVDQGITKQLPWQVFKQGGLRGEKGNTGTTGNVGPIGPTGTVATIVVGTVTSTNTVTTEVSVIATTSTSTPYQTILDFVLPTGPKGDTGTYVPSIATVSSIGGVKIGDGIDITQDGTISVASTQYVLPIATTTATGGVKIGTGITITQDGTISATTATQYVLTTATSVTLGGVKIGAGIGVSADGVISVTTGAFALQTATNVILGGVKIGTGITISATGTIALAIATTSTIGGVKAGYGIDITTGTISVNTGLSLASSLTGSVLASNVTATSITSVGTLTSLTIQGLTTLYQTAEVYSTISTATGIVVHDCSKGEIFVHNSPAANWTANFTNVSSISNRVISVALLINQGVTPRIPSAVQVDGSPCTVNWQGGITPTGNANKKDLVNLTFINSLGAFTVLGSLSSYG